MVRMRQHDCKLTRMQTDKNTGIASKVKLQTQAMPTTMTSAWMLRCDLPYLFLLFVIVLPFLIFLIMLSLIMLITYLTYLSYHVIFLIMHMLSLCIPFLSFDI